jgi:hypothetical protein
LKTLSDVIKLKVPAKDKEAEKNYSYFQLVDLHDKLTLVVGKSDEHQEIIRYFEDVCFKSNL